MSRTHAPTTSAGEGGEELVGGGEPRGQCRPPAMQKQLQPEQEGRQGDWKA